MELITVIIWIDLGSRRCEWYSYGMAHGEAFGLTVAELFGELVTQGKCMEMYGTH